MNTLAETIIEQINTIDRFALMAYGAKEFVRLPESFEYKNTKYLGGLKFKVNGLKHKGYVLILLNAMDEYEVVTYKIRKLAFIEVEHRTGVYAEDLVNVLDALVEYKKVA